MSRHPWARAVLRRTRGRADPEAGSAMVEYLGVVAFVLLPVLYLIVLLAEIQSAAFASTAAARETARVAVAGIATNAPDAEASALAAGDLTAEDFGRTGEFTVACSGCGDPEADAAVTATAEVVVELPAVASFGIDAPSVMTFTATHTEPVDRYREQQ